MKVIDRESVYWGGGIFIIGLLFLLISFGIKIDVVYVFWKFWPTYLIVIGTKNIYSYFFSRR